MKNFRSFAFVGFAALLFSSASFGAVRDSFFLDPFVTIEYSAPRLSGNSGAKHFATNGIGDQIKKFDNIALGFHGRIHKYFGINANWSQTDLSSPSLNGRVLEKKATLGLDYYNFSGLFFAPVIGDGFFEIFGEAGVSRMKSKISIFETGGAYTKVKKSEYKPFVGFGFQLAPFADSKDAIRFSVQRYIGKIDLIDATFTTVRLGYVKSF